MQNLKEFINSTVLGAGIISKIKKFTHPRDYLAAIKHLSDMLFKAKGKHTMGYYAVQTAQIYRNTEPKLLMQAYKDSKLNTFGYDFS